MNSQTLQESKLNVKGAVVKRIQILCADHGIAINKLATEAGIPKTTLYSAISPKHKDVGIVTIKKICDALDISLAEFFSAELFDNLDQEII